MIQHQRIKYACPCCDLSTKTTPAPMRTIPKGLLTESALPWVVVSKFADALPWYRIAALLHRVGGDLSRGTLAAACRRSCAAADQSDARSSSGCRYCVRRRNDCATTQAATLYAGIKRGAVLMTDGYEPYNAIAPANQLVHLGCWAHARRYMIEAEEILPKGQRGGEHPVSELIRCCRKARSEKPSTTSRDNGPSSLATSRTALGPYRTISARTRSDRSPCADGAGSSTGANAAANLYSLIETCKASGVEPYRYLVELFTALPLAQTADEYESLSPWRLALER